MGLPLFIAPVECDIPPNAVDKRIGSLRARSSIRRNRRPEVRDDRAMRRRYESIRDRFNSGASMDPVLYPPVRLARYPWIESEYPPPPDAYVPAPPDAHASHRRHQPPTDFTYLNPNREEERLITVSRWPDRISNSPPTTSAREAGDQDPTLPASRRSGGPRIAARVAARFDRSPELIDGPMGPLWIHHRGSVRRRQHGRSVQVDGLGDRERSLSPEGDGVWDTLLSTLTPDPQPPSVGSSFASASASAAASQSAGPSTSTSFTGPELADEPEVEQPCESGCENSDTEDQDYLSIETEHWTMNSFPSRYRRFVRDLDTIDSGTVSFVRGQVGPLEMHQRLQQIRRANQAARLSVDPSAARERRRLEQAGLLPATRRSIPAARALNPDSRNPAPPAPAQSRNESPPAGDNNEERRSAAAQSDVDAEPLAGPQGGHDDPWHGMQRIFRNLSRREDIPDDWWAAAGLSRTLPDDA